MKITFNTVKGFLVKNSKLLSMLCDILLSSTTILWGTKSKGREKTNKIKLTASKGMLKKIIKEYKRKKTRKYKIKNNAREKPNLWSFSLK